MRNRLRRKFCVDGKQCACERSAAARAMGTHEKRRERSGERRSACIARRAAQARPSRRPRHVRRAALRQRCEVHTAHVWAALLLRPRAVAGDQDAAQERCRKPAARVARHRGRVRRCCCCAAVRAAVQRREEERRVVLAAASSRVPGRVPRSCPVPKSRRAAPPTLHLGLGAADGKTGGAGGTCTLPRQQAGITPKDR